MKNFLCLITVIACMGICSAQKTLETDRIRTKWAQEVTPENVLQEYPRPQLVRDNYKLLNGNWDYAISEIGVAPQKYDGKILVPFCIESYLSGVGKSLDEKHNLWYSRTFTVDKTWAGKRILLHFGAVDWKAEVLVNGIYVGTHTGGYTPFTFDITDVLSSKGEQTLTVKVWDPTDKDDYPVGKQNSVPHGIWYTSVSGIWQTVWMEAVAKENHLEKIVSTTLPNLKEVVIKPTCYKGNGIVNLTVKDGDKVIAKTACLASESAVVAFDAPHLWTPNDPYLYNLEASLTVNGKVVDKATSYFAIRTIDTARDEKGHLRMRLNKQPIFMFGPLDQGWFPDGLYTPATDEALLSDILLMKKIGFNTIRKHIKVESDRYYYHCDREGIIIWQDMPSIWYKENKGLWGRNNMNGGCDSILSQAHKDNFYKEWKEIMEFLDFHPCVCVWVPFNEAWSQFDTEIVATWTKQQDPTRLVNSASGGNMRHCGDILDIHNYPAPALPVTDSERVVVVGEYGGIGYPVKDHLWWNKRNWGYIQFTSTEAVTKEYVKYAKMLIPLIDKGVSAAIYTQTSDVEGEVNGFITYDREVLKMDLDELLKVNTEVINYLK